MKLFPLFLTAIFSLGFFSITIKSTNTFTRGYKIQDSVKIELEKTNFGDLPVLFIKDTAQTNEQLKNILGKAYAELMQFIQDNKLQPQKFMAWYYSVQAPWPIDIAVQTNSIPQQLKGRVQSKTQKASEVIIAHMWGPYDQVGLAYTKIETWLKENKRKAKGEPFEVYINDPASVKNPSEIQTDVYQPID